ncbi:MAG TPA: hypothetical protein VHW00_13585 [Thermoanaerobaculia bacterium]|nr:hypothetical protein [Thermoanaerobaculia bacterium]
MKNALAVLALVLFSGCVIGNTQSFNYVPVDRTDAGAGTVVLLFAVDDQRPYIVSGDEPANFVGEQRNGYGMPFNVTTTDKRPFATIVQETVQRDLEAAGFKVTASTGKAANISSAVQSASADRALAVIMREFKSDTFNNINFDYDFEAVVYDAGGNELARDKIAGEEELKGSMMNPVKAAKQKVPAEFYARIHKLITANPKIMGALKK